MRFFYLCSPRSRILPLTVRADTAPANSSQQLVVLRSGEILIGRISHEADRYLIVSEGTEARLPARDVDFVCGSLDEAYRIQAARISAGKIEGHLTLAQWCLRQGLNGYAAQEITTTMGIDPADPRVAQLDARLQRAMRISAETIAAADAAAAKSSAAAGEGGESSATGTTSNSAARAHAPISIAELDRSVRTLPTSTVENFTRSIQPMLLNYCATAGCHGTSGTSTYSLLRPALGSPPSQRLTQRNLYNTIQWINREQPADSKLLAKAQQAHAAPETTGAACALSPAQYQELVAWVWQSTMVASANLQATVATAKSIGSVPPIRTSAAVAPKINDGVTSDWGTKDVSLQSIAGPEIADPEFSQVTASAPAPMWTAPVIKVSGARIRSNTPNEGMPDRTASKKPIDAVHTASAPPAGSQSPLPATSSAPTPASTPHD